ncbi:MAG: UDP-N-acetylmuramate--L-alanine ligase, partial [Bacteroidetes bacterium]|nr:UDP-N-acetylmuramate--L-alanine ligase [Bacteroidota bacterium]
MKKLRKAVSTFKGIKRRFDIQLKNDNYVYIDDYAHHPEEIKALLNSIKVLYPTKNIVAIFQPHLFSRTQDLCADFAEQLSKADEVLLLPIYPARELPIEGVTSTIILNKINA